MTAIPSILEADKSYTFRSYFEMGILPGDLATEFGYSFSRSLLSLPQYAGTIDRLPALKSQIDEVLPLIDLANESARREVLIGPVLTEVVRSTRSEWRIEYAIKVERRLQGVVDYLLRSNHRLLVVEAKHEDLFGGFSQLESELIAFDNWDRSPSVEQQSLLIGVVTTGVLWQFGTLDRIQQHITQGLNSYRVPEDLEPLLRVLISSLC
ncbi:MAG: hypothetical protein HC769_33070 [Cyanobacteria bacterium CRU_2_1]|nr:hypothetical protein [Cyanobacteria bacterium CRU_2_1]